MNKYTIPCTKEQTKKAFKLGANIRSAAMPLDIAVSIDKPRVPFNKVDVLVLTPPTAEQMIGFILESGKGYSVDLSELIREQGYKQGCLTFIDNCLK